MIRGPLGAREAAAEAAEERALRLLLAEVMRRAVEDYYPDRSERRDKPSRQRNDMIEARAWIFDDGPDSTDYVFGFRSVCSSLGLNPSRIRTAVAARREEIVARLGLRRPRSRYRAARPAIHGGGESWGRRSCSP